MSKAINMSLNDLTIRVIEDGNEVKLITNCSIGRTGFHTPTFEGWLSYQRERLHMSRKYHAPMPYSLFFFDGCAFHEGETHVPSHGCVHLTSSDAPWLFSWAGQDAVAVKISGPYPESPTR